MCPLKHRLQFRSRIQSQRFPQSRYAELYGGHSIFRASSHSAYSSQWDSFAIVYVNGTEAGVSKDTRLPCEFDITDFIKGSSAEIVIKVVRWSDASYVEDQDQWWFGGIQRSVYLYSTEKVFIQDAKALTYIDFSGEEPKGVIPLEVAIATSQAKYKTQTEVDKMQFDVVLLLQE